MNNMYNLENLNERIQKCSAKIFDRDIIVDTIVIVNGKSKNKNDVVVTMSREAYDNLNMDIIDEVKRDIENGKD